MNGYYGEYLEEQVNVGVEARDRPACGEERVDTVCTVRSEVQIPRMPA